MMTRDQLEATKILAEEPYDPAKGYPTGTDLVYRCAICGTFMPSWPANYEEATCQCGHISIDLDAGRLSVGGIGDTPQQPALIRLTPKPTPSRSPEYILVGATGLHISLNVLWWWQPLYLACKPTIEINGVAQPGRWGKQDISLPGGPYRVRVYFPYLGVKQCGLAELAVDLPEGRWVTLAYTPPFTMFQPGKLRIRQL